MTTQPAPIGHNKSPLISAPALAKDFRHLTVSIVEIQAEVKRCPPVVEDLEDLETIRAAVQRITAEAKRVETNREETKEPYLSAGRVVDGYFRGLHGTLDVWKRDLEARSKRFLDRKAAEEKARREAEARAREEEAHRAREAARAAAEAHAKTEQEQREAEARAAQAVQKEEWEARRRERQTRAEAEAAAAEKQSRLRAEAEAAEARALEAHKAAEAKPADLARTRTSDGLSTLAQVWKFEVIDHAAIDLNALREHMPLADIERAIARFVKTHKGDRQLNGVRIYSDTAVQMR